MDKYKTYLFAYHHEGSEWQVEIPATSLEDAKARMQKMPLARYEGELYAKIPAAIPGSGWLVRAWCWWKNLGTLES